MASILPTIMVQHQKKTDVSLPRYLTSVQERGQIACFMQARVVRGGICHQRG